MLTKQFPRRIIVVLYFLLFLVYPVFDDFLGFNAFIAFIIFSPLTFKISSLVKAYYNDNPDERERNLINHAHRLAYTILVPTLIAVLLTQRYGNDPAGRLESLNAVLVFTDLTNLLPFVILALTLPPAIMMWLEPDPISEEADYKLSETKAA